MSNEENVIIEEGVTPSQVDFVPYQPTPEERVAYITSVKKQGTGYFVNGEMGVPSVDGNAHYEDIKIWLSLGNVPEDEFTSDEIEATRIANIKNKAGEIINTKYPAYKQLNASLGVYSEAETTTMVNFIKDIRDQSTKLEKDPTKTAGDFVIGE